MTEWVKGKTLDEALTIKNTQIAEELALPPVKIHCSILAEDAIKAAVSDYKAKHAAQPRRRAAAKPCTDMAVTLTEAAARHVTRYLGKRGKGVGVRLGVKTTGCSGLAYKLEYADDVAPEDHGVRGPRREGAGRPEEPAVHRRHGARLRARGPERGLQVQQPEREGRCGCGESFRV